MATQWFHSRSFVGTGATTGQDAGIGLIVAVAKLYTVSTGS